MFWGLIMEPNKRYTQIVEKPFHISQAAMDIATGDNEPCQVMVVVDGKNFLVCTLQKKNTIQVPLDLYFKTGDSVSFLTNGKCNVHLTGYLDPEFEDGLSDGEEEQEDEEEEDEVPKLVPAKNKRKLENSNDQNASKKPKTKKQASNDEDSSDSDDEDHLQKLLDGDDVDTDENDESFMVNTSAEVDSDEEDSDDDDEDDDDEEGDEDEDGEEEADESSDEAETTLDTSKEETLDMSKLTKNQKKRLQKKLKKQQLQQQEKPQVNGVDKSKKDKPAQEKKADKQDKKADKKEKKQEQAAGDKREKKTLNGGVYIEDLKVGNGPVAKPGQVVMVYYEGRLKQNNKMFDSQSKGPGFKFRLGAKEVITGWDVGIAGMKVGGKRKIVCPPTMAYGAKGSPPVIPGNSTLVFEVELKNVK